MFLGQVMEVQTPEKIFIKVLSGNTNSLKITSRLGHNSEARNLRLQIHGQNHITVTVFIVVHLSWSTCC